MRAIRFNVRKELINVYSPLLPHMKKRKQEKILKEISNLAPNTKAKTVKKSGRLAELEANRLERLKNRGDFERR